MPCIAVQIDARWLYCTVPHCKCTALDCTALHCITCLHQQMGLQPVPYPSAPFPASQNAPGQFHMFLQVTPEERSLAAAMRWQDELTSRGCLPDPGGTRAPSPLPGLANFYPGQLALLQASDSKLQSAGAAAQARASPPTSSLPAMQHAAPLSTAESSSQSQQADTTCHHRHGTPLTITQTDNPPSMQAEEPHCIPGDHSNTGPQQTQGSATKAAGVDSTQGQSAPQVAQLARLPSAKGHCLMSYPNARPQSPIKHPATRGTFLNGMHASQMLSVRPCSVQSQRPSTAAPSADGAAPSKSEPADPCEAREGSDTPSMPQALSGGAEEQHPLVLLRCSQPVAVAQTPTGPQPGTKLPTGSVAAQTHQCAADDIGTAIQLLSHICQGPLAPIIYQ